MIKKALLGICVLGTTLMLCGFDSSQTAESVLNQTSEAINSAASVGTDLNFVCDLDMVFGSSSVTSNINFAIDAAYAIDMTKDPFALYLDGSYTFDGFLQGEPEETTLYVTTSDDGSLGVYTYEADDLSESGGNWSYAEDSSFDYNALAQLAFSADASAADSGMNFTLASEAVEDNGTECYLLSTVLDASELEPYLTEAGVPSDQELYSGFTLEDLYDVLDGIRLNLDCYVDALSYLPVRVHLDLNDSDLTSLNSVLDSLAQAFDNDASSTIEIVLNDISLDLQLSYNSVSAISVPQEILDSLTEPTTEETHEQQSITST